MATMNSEVYAALKEAGTSEEKAVAAAESIANYDNRFNQVDQRFAKVDSTLRLHSWMLTYVVGLLTAVAFKVFS